MKSRFLKSFSKDLDKISDQNDKDVILQVLFSCEKIISLSELKNVKKLSGFHDAYRIRVRNYRIGVFLEKNELVFARVAHRKDIYKIFP
ncbi:type II toxin-antitoxin system RelE family toxin [Algoriphagus chordae]|uniref:mRNA interferase RelE/StbE n=1 Tax=Algoriphagus chordae TaxID=237019 RepID=A0A2W7RFB4_9BACT|nr:type II toxin-antitoxin system RelE/ParE family toxin [Algoriphagus chordae]PZX49405.1 mRNA interferase RelE/StbE [Algoriphagus chordae]